MKRIFIAMVAVWSAFTLGTATAQAQTEAQAKAPSLIVTAKRSAQKGIGLQSFIYARKGNFILFIGGRTNGFHGTDQTDSASNFPPYFANHSIVVYDMATGTIYQKPIPAQYYDQFTSTNMQGWQDGNTLYGCGGYGKNSAGNYVTYNGFFAVDVANMIDAVVNPASTDLSKYITYTTSDDMAVTGGELVKIGNYFYLVMGQYFAGAYNPGQGSQSTQRYTDEIRQFTFTLSGGKLSAKLTKVFTDGNRPDSTSRYHRRDLNVVPILDNKGKEGLAVYGGVFTQKVNGIWQNPVFVLQGNNNQVVTKLDTRFEQRFNQYNSAAVLMFDGKSGTMITTLLGGISLYTTDKNGTVYEDPTAPFTKVISTIYRSAKGVCVETYSKPNQSLPDYVGAEARFIPIESYLRSGSEEIMDLAKIKLSTEPVLVGYMIGGIRASAPSSNNLYPTTSNSTLYEVYLQLTPVTKK